VTCARGNDHTIGDDAFVKLRAGTHLHIVPQNRRREALRFRRRERQPWNEDSAALSDGSGGVTLIAGDAVLTVVAPPPWPPWSTQRTADQLVAALRFAQHRAMAADRAPPPPEISVPARPFTIYALWLATVAATLLSGG